MGKAAPVFQHAALFYAAQDEFLAGTGAFVRDGVASGEKVMVVVSREKIDLLGRALGPDADDVLFLDMAEVGINPARIIPAWRQFVDEHQARGRVVRGIGEPIWPERTPDELVECEHHEALLNVAFEDTEPWRLLCPYDTAGLQPPVVDRARQTHAWLAADGTLGSSHEFRCNEVGVLDAALPPPPSSALSLEVQEMRLAELRRLVADEARRIPFDPPRIDDLVLAVTEIAANSLDHGGGGGTLLVWGEGDSIVCQVDDSGLITDPLVGRRAPSVRQVGGRGLWVANHLCELVQIRSSSAGTTVRLRMDAHSRS